MILAAPLEPQGGPNVAARARGVYFIPFLVSDAGKSVKGNFAGISGNGSSAGNTGKPVKGSVAGIWGVARIGRNAVNEGFGSRGGNPGNRKLEELLSSGCAIPSPGYAITRSGRRGDIGAGFLLSG